MKFKNSDSLAGHLDPFLTLRFSFLILDGGYVFDFNMRCIKAQVTAGTIIETIQSQNITDNLLHKLYSIQRW